MRIPAWAARLDLHGVRQQVVHLAGGPDQGPTTRPSSLGMQGIFALCVHPTVAAQLSCTARYRVTQNISSWMGK